jgi:HAE1 family hydrophobic/amphiphilic exporter-1
MGDLVGQFFRQFGLTVVFAALFSLLVSFTLVPAMAAHLLGKEKERKEDSGGFMDKILRPAYRALLIKSLAHRKIFILIVAFLAAGSLALFPLKAIQTEFMPPFDQGKIVIDLNLGAGANIARTDAAVKAVEEHLAKTSEVDTVFSQIGTENGANFGNIIVRLKDKNRRSKSQSQIAKELRVWARTGPGVDISVTEASIVAQTSVEGNKAFIINITGPDRQILRSIADHVEAVVKGTKGAVDVSNSMRARLSEFSVRVYRLSLSEYSLSASDVATTLRAAFAGAKAGIYRKAGDEFDMIVKFSPEQTRTPADISALTLYSPTGARVTIGQIASITRDDEPSSLERKDRANVVTVMANLQGRPLGALVSDVRAELDKTPLPQGYKYIMSGDTSNMNSSFVSLAWALAASLALVYLVLVVLYESWLTPFIRMLSLPAGIIGGLTAMALTGKSVNIISFIGIIMLDGLISKNGTLLIDYTNTLMKKGLTLRDALLEAGSTRLRPILMTSSTMIVGMLPLALSTGSSSEIKSGMAVVLIGGLISSTLISPLFLPVAYTLIEDWRARFHARGAAKKSEAKK